MISVMSAVEKAAPLLIMVEGEPFPSRDVLQNGNICTETPSAHFPRKSVLSAGA